MCLALVTVGCNVAVVGVVVVDDGDAVSGIVAAGIVAAGVVVAGVAVAWCVSDGMPLVLVDVWHWC